MDGHEQKKWYIEPFLGGGNLFSEVPADKKWGNDIAKYAVALLEAISKGWEPPKVLDELSYFQIKEDPESYDPALVGFAAYCCSYAGKFWGGYARGNDSKGRPRNFAAEQVRNLEKQCSGLKQAKFTNLSYEKMDIPICSTVYCDPPYNGTTGYQKGFNHDDFWSWCGWLARSKGCRVFVSEYSAPQGWVSIWSKTVNNTLVKDTGAKTGEENLWVLS
jgi:DNA adenine methylase